MGVAGCQQGAKGIDGRQWALQDINRGQILIYLVVNY